MKSLKSHTTLLGSPKLRKGLRRGLLAVLFFSMGLGSFYINKAIGLYSPVMIVACIGMCLTLLLGLITRNFSDSYARTTLKNLRKIFFKLGFALLNGILAPFSFLLIASVISPDPNDWKWGVAALLFGGFTFVMLLNFLVSMREFFTGLTHEIRFNRPLSIL